MSCFRLSLFVLSLVSLIVAIPVQAQEETTTTTVVTPATPVVVERPVIITTAPAPKEVIIVPKNYTNCIQVKGWFGDVWDYEHKLCLYKGVPEGVVWVEGHFRCTKYDLTTRECTNTEWVAPIWVH